MTKKDYKDRNIIDEINIKVNTLNKTRGNRINVSARLDKYSNHWEIIFLIMNIIAVITTIISIMRLPQNNFSIVIVLSSVFSIYTILVQYFVSTKNYNERSLKFHYQEISIETLIMELKNLLIGINNDKAINKNEIPLETSESLTKEYKNIMGKYFENLTGYENHAPIDNLKRKRTNNGDETPRDFTTDNIIIYFQYIFVAIYLILYILPFIIN